MILTRSYRTKKAKSGYISQLRTYKPSFTSPKSNGKVLKNAAMKVTTMPPMVKGGSSVWNIHICPIFIQLLQEL